MKLFKTTMSVLVLFAVMLVPTKKGCTQCLINESSALNRFVPNYLSESKITYAYPDNDKTESEKEEPSKRKFFGLNVGIGFAFHKEDWEDWDDYHYNNKYYGLPITLGFDYAAPITPKFNLGLYFSVGYEARYGDVPTTIGPLFIFNLNKGSLYTGAGFHADLLSLSLGGDLRLGYEFNFGLYIFYEHALTKEDIWVYSGSFGSKSIIHIGFNFLNKKK